MLVDGRLQDADHVRAEGGGDWQTLDSVIGLIRAADRLRSEAASQAAALGRNSNQPVGSGDPVRSAGESKSDDSSISARDVTHSVSCDSDILVVQVPLADEISVATMSRSISLARTIILSLVIGTVGWFGWSAWHESQRFPAPAHMRSRPAPWTLPLIGPVTGFEVSLLAFDVIALTMLSFWWLRSRRRAK